jgi:hypothetical protein
MRVWELFRVMVSHAASKHEDCNRYRILSPFRHLVILQSTFDDPRPLSPAILCKFPRTLLYRPFPLFLLHFSNTSLTFCQTLWSRTAVSITTLTSACYASSVKLHIVTRALLICIHLPSEDTSGLSARGVQSWKLDFLVFLTSRGVGTPLQPFLVQHTLG